MMSSSGKRWVPSFSASIRPSRTSCRSVGMVEPLTSPVVIVMFLIQSSSR